MKNNRSSYFGNYSKGGETVGIKLLVMQVVSIKLLRLEGLSKAFLVKFDAAENIINCISAGRGQYTDSLQTIYNCIKKLIKPSIIMSGIAFRNQEKLSNSSKKSSEDQDFLMISNKTKVNQFAQIRQALEANFGNSS